MNRMKYLVEEETVVVVVVAAAAALWRLAEGENWKKPGGLNQAVLLYYFVH